MLCNNSSGGSPWVSQRRRQIFQHGICSQNRSSPSWPLILELLLDNQSISIPHPLPGCRKTDESILQTIFVYTWAWSRISDPSYFLLCYIIPTVEALLYLRQFKWNQNAPLWRQCQLRQELTQKTIIVTILTKCLSKLVSVSVQKMHLKARSLPPYFYIKLTPSSYPLFIHACNLILKVRNYSSLG